MNRLMFAPLALCLAMGLALPAAAATKKSAHPRKTAPKPKAQPEQPEVLSEGQLSAAGRVFTGRADCEFKQAVDVEPVNGQPGHFDVRFGKWTYHMVPEETTTGAVRLHDKRADVVWLQIPMKSMLMNNKLGQRMVDACQLPQQRAAVEAVTQARVAASAAATATAAAASAASAASAAEPANTMAAAAAAQAAQAASAAAAAASAAVAGQPDGSVHAGLGLKPGQAASAPVHQ